MSWKRAEFWLAAALVVYLVAVGIVSAIAIVANFPTQHDSTPVFPHTQGSEAGSNETVVIIPFGALGSPAQALLLLAFLAGIAGSFLHAAQSLSTYLGNVKFKKSWTVWYVLRPWIGGILGLILYFAFRAGLVGGSSPGNPYGVVALGALGGWFSKTTTDKLQEVFSTLFKTDEDTKRKDKLQEAEPPLIERVEPSPVPADSATFTVFGCNFADGATVMVAGKALRAELVSDKELRVPLGPLSPRPPAGQECVIQVKNPDGPAQQSQEHMVIFE